MKTLGCAALRDQRIHRQYHLVDGGEACPRNNDHHDDSDHDDKRVTPRAAPLPAGRPKIEFESGNVPLPTPS